MLLAIHTPKCQKAASAVVASRAFLRLLHSPHTTPTGRARLLDSSTSRGPFSFWRRLPDTDPHLPHKPFFAFPNPEHFPVALLALDLLIRPPVLGEPHAEDVVCHHMRATPSSPCSAPSHHRPPVPAL